MNSQKKAYIWFTAIMVCLALMIVAVIWQTVIVQQLKGRVENSYFVETGVVLEDPLVKADDGSIWVKVDDAGNELLVKVVYKEHLANVTTYALNNISIVGWKAQWLHKGEENILLTLFAIEV